MKRFLIVVDMQKDFVDGALGTREAVQIVPHVARKIKGFEGTIFVTLDTHSEDYLSTAEGKKLPVTHCVKGTDGWMLNKDVADALKGKRFVQVEKPTFGSLELPKLIAREAGGEDFSIEMIGLCTDICVVSNALILRAAFPDAPLSADAACCAGVRPETHRAALDVMRCCQIDVEEA